MAKRICTIEDCGKPVTSRGWCMKHYARWRAHGDPMGGRAYGVDRRCTIEGCDKPHSARGLCRSHYQSAYPSRCERTCVVCGLRWLTERKDAQFCSDRCKGQRYSEIKTTKLKLPVDHPVMVLIRQTDAERRVLAQSARHERRVAIAIASAEFWRDDRECPGCACWFSPVYKSGASQQSCCSYPCRKRMMRRRRRAREAGARGSWRWSEFMRVARKFDYCCAYCGTKPDRLDPDHVVPLSRGGNDSVSNLLPSCPLCNSSKCAMTLTEWTAWITERGLPSRRTEWAMDDTRYTHLTDALLVSLAA